MKSNLRTTVSALAILSLSFVAGCKSYQPNPVNWDELSSHWNKTLHQAEIDLDGALQFALALNPDINALRLKKLSSEKYAAVAGWWEDPSFGFDAMRILNGGEHPQLGGFGVNFTLPVNGVPKLRKLAAERYSDADLIAVTVAERNLTMRIVQCWVSMVYATERVALLDQTLQRHSKLSWIISGLVDAGEMDKSSGDRLMLEQIGHRYALIAEQQSLEEQRAESLTLIGIHPLAEVNLKLSKESIVDWETPTNISNDLDLVAHPSVQEGLVRLDASEQDLRIEIRRQYPDIEIGPRYGHEDGTDRLGIQAGLTLPLWNRNQQGIAGAEGMRDMQRDSAVIAWKTLVQRYHKVQLATSNSLRRVALLEEERIPAIQAIAARMEALFKKGESDITGVLEAQHSLFDAQAELLDAKEELVRDLVEKRYIAMQGLQGLKELK